MVLGLHFSLVGDWNVSRMGEFKRQEAVQTLSTLPHNQTPLLIRARASLGICGGR